MLQELSWQQAQRAVLQARHSRSIERVRYGFKTQEGKQNHLKLYQIKHYLNDNFNRYTEKMT
jgi:hypothetical protein